MALSRELITFGRYLAGEFENQQQALAEPAWYVHLRLWLRPVPLFSEDSVTLFAEQASIVNLDNPYRSRLWRLRQVETNPLSLQVEHYMFDDITAVRGGGRDRALLENITAQQIRFLPDCTLDVDITNDSNCYHFKALPKSDKPCCFTYQEKTYQVALGFEVTSDKLKTYDRGIDPATGKSIWGALMGPYCFSKLQDFSVG